MIRFQCPSCQRHINAKDSSAGKQSKCPGCGSPVTVPTGVSDDDIMDALGDYQSSKPVDELPAEFVERESLAVVEAVQSVEEPSPPLKIVGLDLIPALLIGSGVILLLCCGVIGMFVPETQPTPEALAAKAEQEAKQERDEQEFRERLERERAERERERAERQKELDAELMVYNAWEAAKHFVKQNLRSPSTASFGSAFGESQDPEECVKKFGNDGTYIVTGWVDGQNAFGATVRNDFSVKIQKQGNQWALTGEVVLYPR